MIMANEELREMLNKLFEDKDKNGIPDLFEQQSADGKNTFQVFSDKVNVNGKEYASVDELPPEIKEKIKQAFSMPGKNKQTGTVAGTALKKMPEIYSAGQPEKKPTANGTANYQFPVTDADSKRFRFSISKKWVYAFFLLALLFLIWVLNNKH